MRVPNRFSGIRDFPSLKLGIRDFTAKSGRDSGLKVCAGGGMPKITLRIKGLLEILGQDYGIEKPYWRPSLIVSKLSPSWSVESNINSIVILRNDPYAQIRQQPFSTIQTLLLEF